MSERPGRGHLDFYFIIYTEKEPISHRPASIIICMYAITELNSTHISSDFLSRSKEVIKLVIICNIIDFHLLFKESYHPLSHFTLLPPLSPLLPLLLWKWPQFVLFILMLFIANQIRCWGDLRSDIRNSTLRN